jgi:hypothetical protein
MAELEATLRLLSSASDSLNKASDSLNESISQVEAALQPYNLGIAVWVEVERVSLDPDRGIEEVIQLGYGKLDGKWGLLTSSYRNDGPDETWDERFLRDASRYRRFVAIDKLSDLISKLVEEADKSAKATTVRAEKTRQIATSLARKAK